MFTGSEVVIPSFGEDVEEDYIPKIIITAPTERPRSLVQENEKIPNIQDIEINTGEYSLFLDGLYIQPNKKYDDKLTVKYLWKMENMRFYSYANWNRDNSTCVFLYDLVGLGMPPGTSMGHDEFKVFLDSRPKNNYLVSVINKNDRKYLNIIKPLPFN